MISQKKSIKRFALATGLVAAVIGIVSVFSFQAKAAVAVGTKCYCAFWGGNDDCLTNNGGSSCASFPGNGNCRDFDGNCGSKPTTPTTVQ